MKTSELKKIVEENGGVFENNVDDAEIYIHNKCENVANINKNRVNEFNLYSCPKVIAQVVLEYAYTPLEEREEEKKYWLVFPKAFHNEIEIVLGKYSNGYDCCGTEASKEKFKVKFTQKEIHEMPFDTKFFEKVEVK